MTKSFLAGGWRECKFPCGLASESYPSTCPEVGHLHLPGLSSWSSPFWQTLRIDYLGTCIWAICFGLWYDHRFLSPLPSTVVVKMSDPRGG